MNNIKTLIYVFFKTKTRVKRMMDMHFVIFLFLSSKIIKGSILFIKSYVIKVIYFNRIHVVFHTSVDENIHIPVFKTTATNWWLIYNYSV